MSTNPRIKPLKVSRKDADDVYYATATEPLRRIHAKNPLHLSQPERDAKNKKAEEVVEKANRKKKR